MTIYAIVNNLIGKGQAHCGQSPIWTVISASAMLQGGNPYFVPDFSDSFEARAALALRIGKLGKSIAPRFARRYVDGVAPASVMLAPGLLSQLRERCLPWTQSISYDRSIAIGKFMEYAFDDISRCTITLTLINNGEAADHEFMAADLTHSVEETISAISRDNALKTGDIILVGISDKGPVLTPGQRIILSSDGQQSLKFNIR